MKVLASVTLLLFSTLAQAVEFNLSIIRPLEVLL
jgi:hypothetical protein